MREHVKGFYVRTYGDRAFPVVASRVWNSLPHHVTSAQSLPVCCSRLTTYLFRRSFPRLFCCAREVTLVTMDTLIALTYLFTAQLTNAGNKNTLHEILDAGASKYNLTYLMAMTL